MAEVNPSQLADDVVILSEGNATACIRANNKLLRLINKASVHNRIIPGLAKSLIIEKTENVYCVLIPVQVPDLLAGRNPNMVGRAW